MRRPGSALLATALLATAILATTLGACGETRTPAARIAGEPAGSAPTRSATAATRSATRARTTAPTSTPARSATRTRTPTGRRSRDIRRHGSRMTRLERAARETYRVETRGTKLRHELARIARDGALLDALARGDRAAAEAAAEAELTRPGNHVDHVTRIGVVRGSRALVNATVNADGVFVVAPAKRVLRRDGRTLGTLAVSIQDLAGYVKLVHDLTGADVVVRGSSGRERTSLPAAMGVALPRSGEVTIAGGRYSVRSFSETGWGDEASDRERLRIWILG